MIRGGGVSVVVLQALKEAQERFGSEADTDMVAKWVAARVRQLTGERESVDAKWAQSGEME